MFAINLDVGNVVLENGGNIDLRSSSVRTTSLVRKTYQRMLMWYEKLVAKHATAFLAVSGVWGKGGMLTSGKVPLEKTLERRLC